MDFYKHIMYDSGAAFQQNTTEYSDFHLYFHLLKSTDSRPLARHFDMFFYLLNRCVERSPDSQSPVIGGEMLLAK